MTPRTLVVSVDPAAPQSFDAGGGHAVWIALAGPPPKPAARPRGAGTVAHPVLAWCVPAARGAAARALTAGQRFKMQAADRTGGEVLKIDAGERPVLDSPADMLTGQQGLPAALVRGVRSALGLPSGEAKAGTAPQAKGRRASGRIGEERAASEEREVGHHSGGGGRGGGRGGDERSEVGEDAVAGAEADVWGIVGALGIEESGTAGEESSGAG
ncbi:hypothetical protein MNEG_4448, partial [Monoraphidium neglectum]